MFMLLQIGILFVGFGFVSLFVMSPESMFGKVSVVVMGVAFILSGVLFTYRGIKEIDQHK